MKRPAETHVHRFRNLVEVSFIGVDGPTIYLNPREAHRIARALEDAALDVESTEFVASGFTGVTVAREEA